ncbi:nucleotidyltransferase family protein [Virgibacillus sp. C22-A2]|uniref:Nucleotidyltransferase family protein n=1 Tax=Virgibacillus tibetensis TaxID=3042313 RepID=A0ABU6KG47_9BACI|nr:nucleotidyltransferase family protein [Virgibacillus sp. C22-A2]
MDNLNLEDVPKELKLLLELLRSDYDTVVDLHSKLFTAVDWNLFMELSMHHRIFPLLFSKLKVTNSDMIPPYVIEFISQQYKKNTFQMLYLSGEMEKVAKIFSAKQLPLLFLKGPALAHDLYGDISLRTSSDLDILIPIDKLEKAEELLVEEGYVKDDYIQTVLNDWKWRHHHITFFHPQKRIKLEIHWRLNPGPAREPGFDELWKRKRKSKLTGTSIYILSKEDLFLFLVSHGSRHGWSRLRWLMDIGQLIKKDVDWALTMKTLGKYRYHRAGGQAIILASQLVDSGSANEIAYLTSNKSINQLAQQAVFYLERMVNLHTDPVPEEVARYHKRHLFSLMSLEQKFFFIISFLHPYPEDKEALPLPNRIHFLYFPLRPFLWAWRKTRKHALQ